METVGTGILRQRLRHWAECTHEVYDSYRSRRSQDPAKSGEIPALTRNGEASSPTIGRGRVRSPGPACETQTLEARADRGDAAGFLSSKQVEERVKTILAARSPARCCSLAWRRRRRRLVGDGSTGADSFDGAARRAVRHRVAVADAHRGALRHRGR